QTDNGAEFQTAFHWHVQDKGIGHVYIKPRTPRLNGKVERSHRIDAEEFYRLLDGVVIDDTKVFNDKLQEWEDYYNYHRPHGALDGQTPYERLRQKTHPAVADLPQPHNVMAPVDTGRHGLRAFGTKRSPAINLTCVPHGSQAVVMVGARVRQADGALAVGAALGLHDVRYRHQWTMATATTRTIRPTPRIGTAHPNPKGIDANTSGIPLS